MNEIEIVRKNGYAYVINFDDAIESPREWDNLGKMLLDGHKKYTFPIETTYEEIKKAKVRLPVYMYEHSGIVLSTHDFNDPWDSGLLGCIVAYPDDIKKEFNVKRITKKIINKVIDILKSEVEIYSNYANGECYSFTVYKVDDNTEDITEGILIDSCGGYYNIKDAIESAEESMKYAINNEKE